VEKKERYDIHNKSNNSPRKGSKLLLLKKGLKLPSKQVSWIFLNTVLQMKH